MPRLAIVVTLLTIGGCVAPHTGAPATIPAPTELGRPIVSPYAMSAGTQTMQAGLQYLDSVGGDDSTNEALVYVPTRCVGTRRVPLIVLLHGSYNTGSDIINFEDRTTYRELFKEFADSNGVILLAPNSQEKSGWSLSRDEKAPSADELDIDVAIRRVIHRYPIDTTRIALLGESGGGLMALLFGLMHGNVFSRIIAFSPSLGQGVFKTFPRHGMPAIFIALARAESLGPVVPWLRNAGYSVTYTEDDLGHGINQERSVSGLRWLVKSWQ